MAKSVELYLGLTNHFSTSSLLTSFKLPTLLKYLSNELIKSFAYNILNAAISLLVKSANDLPDNQSILVLRDSRLAKVQNTCTHQTSLPASSVAFLKLNQASWMIWEIIFLCASVLASQFLKILPHCNQLNTLVKSLTSIFWSSDSLDKLSIVLLMLSTNTASSLPIIV